MKRTRHSYHYTVRRLKKSKPQAIKLKLAANFNNSSNLWHEIFKLNPAKKMLPDVIDNAKTAEEITPLFQEKYKEICTSVPTIDKELNLINEDINNLIRVSNENEYSYISPNVVRLCITRLKPTKIDGDTGFNSNHLINDTHRLYTILCLLFNSLIIYG